MGWVGRNLLLCWWAVLQLFWPQGVLVQRFVSWQRLFLVPLGLVLRPVWSRTSSVFWVGRGQLTGHAAAEYLLCRRAGLLIHAFVQLLCCCLLSFAYVACHVALCMLLILSAGFGREGLGGVWWVHNLLLYCQVVLQAVWVQRSRFLGGLHPQRLCLNSFCMSGFCLFVGLRA